MARANRRRPRTRKRKSQRRGWLLVPLIILAVMLGWLYRHEIVKLVTFQFEGIDFSRRPGESARSDHGGGRITETERKELEKILRNQ